MIVALIGNRSINAVQDVIKKNFDNLELHTYKSISNFINEMSVRSLDVSRMIIMQDGIQDEQNLDELLRNFFEYLAKYYPSMRVISLAKDINLTHKIASIFISPLCAHIVASTVKPRMILDMVGKDIMTIRNEYGYKEIKAGESDLVETIGDSEPEEVPEVIDQNQQQSGQPPQDNEKDQKKKKGLFGMFGGKKDKKDKKKKDNKNREVIGQYAADQEVDKPVMVEQSTPEGDGISEEDYFAKLEANMLAQNGTVEINAGAEEDDDDDMDFSMYGEGFNEPTSAPEPEPEPEPSLENINFSTKENQSGRKVVKPMANLDKIFENATEQPKTQTQAVKINPEALIKDENSVGKEYNNTTANDEPDPSLYGRYDDNDNYDDIDAEDDPFAATVAQSDIQGTSFTPSLDIEENEGTPDNITDDTKKDINDKKERIRSMTQEALSKEVDTDLSGIGKPANKRDFNLNIEAVSEGDDLGISDIDSMQKAYQEQTTPTVEKIVERLVPMSGGRGKNGVRYIIITGDRRSGVTRCALQLAAYWAKKQATLFVDCDIARRGSLAYLDLDDILDCQDMVCNGLGCFKKLSNLTNLTYRDMKHKFDCLISVYNNDLTGKDLEDVSLLIGAQRDYSVVILDCPLEQLPHVHSLLPYSDIYMCVESNYLSLLNTIIGVTTLEDLTKEDMLAMYNGMKYLVTKGFDQQMFDGSMQLVADLFDFRSAEFDWSDIPVGATIKNLGTLVNS